MLGWIDWGRYTEVDRLGQICWVDVTAICTLPGSLGYVQFTEAVILGRYGKEKG